MCGIVGIYSHQEVANELLDSLIHLQHRGQDAAGILTCTDRFYSKHGLGLVREIFSKDHLPKLKGKLGIAHTRYPTAGGYDESDIQPMWLGNPRGIALAHNGNLTNYQELATKIQSEHRHLNSSSDSELLLGMLAQQLSFETHVHQDDESFFQHLVSVLKKFAQEVHGSYSVVAIIIGKGMIAFRDPHGIRPLVIGERKGEDGRSDYIFASETSAFYSLSFEPKGDLKPGEVAYVSLSGKLFREQYGPKQFAPCVFEYVYFARPDSTIDDVSVYRARLHMGQNLARAWKEKFSDRIPDVVVPAPFTANTAALAFANELGVPYSEGLYKNPFIGRTFIMSNQQSRARNVRYKLTPQRAEIENKKVLLVDDSIVRGTTSREIVKMIREFGAKEVYFASSSPPIKHPCFYGIDIPTRNELIAHHSTLEEIRNALGVDALLYQSQEDLIEAVTRHSSFKKLCMGCMNGQYVCGRITEEKIERLEEKRKQEKTG